MEFNVCKFILHKCTCNTEHALSHTQEKWHKGPVMAILWLFFSVLLPGTGVGYSIINWNVFLH